MALVRGVLVCVIVVMFSVSSWAGWLDSLSGLINSAGSGERTSVTYKDKEMAIREALKLGAEYAVSHLSRRNGFLDNPLVRIPVPKSLQVVASFLKSIGQEKIVDDFVAEMNHAAEKATSRTLSIFIRAIEGMSMSDVDRILLGGDNAATEYLRRKTYGSLFDEIKPIVTETTSKTGVTKYYKLMMGVYNRYSKPLKILSSISEMVNGQSYIPPKDLDTYITKKAIDGIFLMIAQEEKKIRENPAARVTALLKKVFGSINR